jgi:hypothetical protein
MSAALQTGLAAAAESPDFQGEPAGGQKRAENRATRNQTGPSFQLSDNEKARTQVRATSLVTAIKTEREGFEPSDPISGVTSLAMMRIRPLCHLSNRHRQAQYTRISPGNKYRVFRGTSSENPRSAGLPETENSDLRDFADYRDWQHKRHTSSRTGSSDSMWTIVHSEPRRAEPLPQAFSQPFAAPQAPELPQRIPPCHRSAFPSARVRPAESQSLSSASPAGDRQ